MLDVSTVVGAARARVAKVARTAAWVKCIVNDLTKVRFGLEVCFSTFVDERTKGLGTLTAEADEIMLKWIC